MISLPTSAVDMRKEKGKTRNLASEPNASGPRNSTEGAVVDSG